MDRGYGGGSERGNFTTCPMSVPKTIRVPVEDQQIPPGELAVSRGTRVNATDGYVGHVDELVVDRENGHITHLVMREGHLWGQKDCDHPSSAMGERARVPCL